MSGSTALDAAMAASRFTEDELEEFLGVDRAVFESEIKAAFDEQDVDNDGKVSSTQVKELLTDLDLKLSEDTIASIMQGTTGATSFSFDQFLKLVYDVIGVEIAMAKGNASLQRSTTQAARKGDAMSEMLENMNLIDKVVKSLGGEEEKIPLKLIIDYLNRIPELKKHDAAVRGSIKTMRSSGELVDEHTFSELLIDMACEGVNISIKSILESMLRFHAAE